MICRWLEHRFGSAAERNRAGVLDAEIRTIVLAIFSLYISVGSPADEGLCLES